MTEYTVEDILETSKRSFKFFMNAILGYQNPDFLDKLDDVLSDPVYRKIVAAYPRGHGKSTHLSIGYPLWRIAQDHNLRIFIVSNTSSSSQKFLRGIINQIEGNEKYIAFAKYCDPNGIGVVPKMVKSKRIPEQWSGSGITINRDDISIKDSTISAVGLFGPLIGKRGDIIIGDDIVDQKNSGTEEQRQKIKDWFHTTLIPILVTDQKDKNWKIIYLGNTWNMNDLVHDLLHDPQFEYRERLKAIISEPTNMDLWNDWAKIKLDESIEPHARLIKADNYYEQNKVVMEEGVKVLWPEKMPYKELYLSRISNSYAFARMYQCDPSSRPDQKFVEAWLNKSKEKGKNLRLQDEPREGFTMDLTTSGLDLAISMKDSADDTVLITIDRVKYGNDLIKPGDFVLRNIKRGKMTPDNVRRMVKTHNDTVHPLGIRVESVAYQESMVRDLQDMGQANVRGHKTGGEKNDMDIGVNSLAILLEIGKFIIPYDISDPRTVYLCGLLVDEMRSYPEGHTGDSLMALWFAYLEARDLTGSRIVIPVESVSSVPIKMPEAERKDEELKVDLAIMRESEKERRRGTHNSGVVF